MYINCKTFFSFKYGILSTRELVANAVELGINKLALTNINNTCDMWDFVELCITNQIKPVAGVEIRNQDQFMYLLLAKNNEGFYQINKFLSGYLHNKTNFPLHPDLDDSIYIIYSPENRPPQLKKNDFISFQITEINKLASSEYQKITDKLLIRQPVTFLNTEKHYKTHCLLRAIDKNIVISKLDKKDTAQQHEFMIAEEHLQNIFKDYPYIITNTQALLNNCSIEINFATDKTKKLFSKSVSEDKSLLKKLTLEGLKIRYGNNKIAEQRVNKELDIINNLGFNAYFLTTWDIVNYAHNKGFYYVGRGSGANSIVAFCLKITDVDPIELDLYFERFLNPNRTVPPDFDMDFSWKDRDQIFEYIFNKYGEEHVCLLGSFVTFQSKAILRELGKVFGLPAEEIDQLELGYNSTDKISSQIIEFGKVIKDFPNHISIHAGGVLISEKPIHYYTATTLLPKGFISSQIDMFAAEKIGLYKLDILSQRGLGHIKETLEIVKKNRNISIDIHQIENFKKDPLLAEKIREANTIGCFYIESPAMRQLLKKLRCDDYITLVAASSIIRPGVSQSGMMKQYIYRFHNPNNFQYLHPKMEELLKETYGVMVYQEDVIKVAHHFAGLDMAEADVLRRAMSGKYRGREQFENIKRNFFKGCKEKEYPDDITAEVWRQIESFGGYSFSKAHSASFAVESYQSLYLKTYYPMEFMVAVINNFGGFYSRELYFRELSNSGATIHEPCINNSEAFTNIKDCNVFIGFIHIDGLENSLIQKIIETRLSLGLFEDLNHFIEKIDPGIEQLNKLIRVGCFRFTNKTKKELLWQANFLQKKSLKSSTSHSLFKEKPIEFKLESLVSNPLDDVHDQIELLGFTVADPFNIVVAELNKYIPANKIKDHLGKTILVIGYLITTKAVRTIKSETMYFHTFIDQMGNWLDTIFFPPAAQKYNVTGKGFYEMKGKVTEEFGVYNVEVFYARKLGIKTRKDQPNNYLLS